MQLLRDLSLGEIVSRLAAVLIYAALQGGSLALAARLMGDRRPEHDGRVTLNPFTHLSVWGAAMAVVFGVSWVRSIWYDTAANRWGSWGVSLVVAVGLLAMVALVPLVDLVQLPLLTLPRTASYAALYVLDQLQEIALASAILNLLPLPGLVGGGWLQAWWPGGDRRLRQWEPIALGVVIAVVVAGGFPDLADRLLPFLRTA